MELVSPLFAIDDGLRRIGTSRGASLGMASISSLLRASRQEHLLRIHRIAPPHDPSRSHSRAKEHGPSHWSPVPANFPRPGIRSRCP